MYVLHERDPSLGPIPVREYRAMLNDEGRSAIDAAVTDVLQRGEPQQFELTLNLPSGATAHHRVVGIPLKNEEGQVVGLRGTSQDIRDRILLDQLQIQIAHLSRVEAMNAMAATLAHELNQPLAAAANYLAGSQRMLKGGTPGEAAEGMAAAEQQVHLAAEIIRKVREMVSNQPKSVTSVSLDRVIDDAAALLAVPRLYPKLALRKDIGNDAAGVTGDRVQIQQVLINLIRNAGDATAGRPDPELTISSRRDEAGNVLVCVADNGSGFSQPADDRFSPFASTKQHGLGLGLSISRTIIEAHGGRIWIEDGESDGARICFTLPAAKWQESA
jgi:two-component system sensor kinase FixL